MVSSLAPHRPLLRRLAMLAFCLAGLAPRGIAAPEYAVSGRGKELEASVLAQTPSGPVTALDLLIFDEMTDQALWDIPLDALVEPKSLEAEKYAPRIREGIDRLAATQALAQRSAAWQPPADQLRVMTYGAAEAVWVEENVKPKVEVMPADVDRFYLANATDYLRRRQVQVRYIFRSVNTANAAATQRARDQLSAIAAPIRAGSSKFEDVARRESDARSSADGGLLPPFYDGTYFPEFEQQAFSMDAPGQLSQVFEGPGGVYLEQLVQSFPVRNIPIEDVRGEIAEKLKHEHVRHYFDYEYGKLTQRIYGRNFSFYWPYLNADAPIAIVGRNRLERADFMRFYGDPIDDKFQVRWDVIGKGAQDWIQGETILRDLQGMDQGKLLLHSWVRRASELAEAALRARHTIAAEASPASFATPEASLATLQADSNYLPGFREYHLVTLTISPAKDKENDPESQRRSERLGEFIEEQLRAGKLPTEPVPIDLAEWRAKALLTAASTRDAVKELSDAVDATHWVGVDIKIRDTGWTTPIPGSPVARLLAGVADGSLGRTQVIAETRIMYYVLQSRTPSLDKLKAEPLDVRVLAFQAESAKLRAEESRTLADRRAIVYQF